ncbi:hypothetical protein AN639_10095 [Candidatus Epulonipiscium fishelsonii]|uniref:Uncharacterized protein n=1 Tax=Candidatus Epulonipiscium fishelsonii TaxID=77094 RepID=A0ACC8X8G4_9FIRM|nr:hypothetical protein AN396_11245 [Epulopiscium sp. SCG-B11WGA-EpuloA1]ONI43672.1 hypothetical protein AN639_10095 [Epulopiscium sp. SCG-B05WGA-EpuloA1]
MDYIEISLVAVGLSMDALAVATCQGVKMQFLHLKVILSTVITFGLFQAIMPFLGWLIGIQFESLIQSFDHWIAFGLLEFIGLKMYKEASNDDIDTKSTLDFKKLLIMGVATSIDALAVGISFAILPNINIIPTCIIIGIITICLCLVGIIVGYKIGKKYNVIAEKLGGIVLMLLGLKILIEELFL